MPDEKTQQERQRISAILTCEEASGREDLARMLALETNHDLNRAKAILKAAPRATTLTSRMGEIPNPIVGVGGTSTGTGSEDTSASAEVQRILAFVPAERLHPKLRPPQARPQ